MYVGIAREGGRGGVSACPDVVVIVNEGIVVGVCLFVVLGLEI